MAKRTTKPTAELIANPQEPVTAVEGEQIVPAVITEISGGLPSTDTGPETAKPESKPVKGDASSSSVEASTATAPTTETGQATGQGETGALPVADTTVAASVGDVTSDLAPHADDLIRITSKKEGFRRAGIRHSKTPTDHLIADFTDEQLALLETEPNLIVEYL